MTSVVTVKAAFDDSSSGAIAFASSWPRVVECNCMCRGLGRKAPKFKELSGTGLRAITSISQSRVAWRRSTSRRRSMTKVSGQRTPMTLDFKPMFPQICFEARGSV